MRYANLALLVFLVRCGSASLDRSPWELAQHGTVHVDADLTSALDGAILPSPGEDVAPQSSKVRIEGVTRAGIYMQTPCRARFWVFVHPGARFLAWAAMLPQAWNGSSDGALFCVSILGPGTADSVLVDSLRVNPRVNDADRRWFRREVPLSPWAGQHVLIELAVWPGEQGDSFQDWCIWGEPVVFSPPISPPHLTPRSVNRALAQGELRLDWCFTSARRLDASGVPEENPRTTTAVTLDGAREDGLYAHPPWSLSHTFTPGPRARLVTALGMVEECWEQSDGVTMRVRAQRFGEQPRTVFQYWLSPRANRCDRRWVNVEVDLSPYVGSPVTVTLETTAGPADDLTCDSAAWASPRVVSVP